MVRKADYDIKTLQKFSLEMYKILKTIHQELWLDVNAFATYPSALDLFNLIDDFFVDMEGDNQYNYNN